MAKRDGLWWALFILASLPLIVLLYRINQQQLGANPVQAIHFYLGEWTLRFLCVSLALSPIRKINQWKWPTRFRRMVGLFTFFYASLHVLNYLVVDHAWVWGNIAVDIVESPYILMGLITYSIVLSMAITSTKGWQQRLGGYWKKLHRFIYIGAITALLHYFWHLKGNLAAPFFYSIIIGLLLFFRCVEWYKKRKISRPLA